MKINFFTILGLLFAPAAFAASNCPERTCPSNVGFTGKSDSCASYKDLGCHYSPAAAVTLHMYQCLSCKGNKILKSTNNYDCSNVSMPVCECGNNCKDSEFKSTGTAGYLSGVKCGDECNNATQYICAAGYYGKPTNGSSGCTKCVAPATSAQGSTTIADCYIPKGNYSDNTGKYAFNCDCPYNGRNTCGSDSGSSSSSAA